MYSGGNVRAAESKIYCGSCGGKWDAISIRGMRAIYRCMKCWIAEVWEERRGR